MSGIDLKREGQGFLTLPQLWLDVCRRSPDQIAMRHKMRGVWSGTSWVAYYDAAKAFSVALSKAGIARGDVLSILSENRPEWLFAAMGAQARGVISHGIYPTDSAERVGDAIRSAGSSAILVEDAEQLRKVLDVRATCPKLELIVVIETRGMRGYSDPQLKVYSEFCAKGSNSGEDQQRFDASILAGRGSEVACLATTAASTGPAKLTVLTQANLVSVAKSLSAWLTVHEGDKSLSFTSLASAAETTLSMVAPIVAPLVVHFPESPATVTNDLQEVTPQIVFAPPRFWEHLHAQTEMTMDQALPVARDAYRRVLRSGTAQWRKWVTLRNVRASLGLQNVRMAIAGAAAIAPELVRWYLDIGVPMFEGYVLAEAGGFASLVHPKDALVGAPLSPVEGVETQLTRDGEILIGGSSVAAGYWIDGRLQVVEAATPGIATGDYGVPVGANGIRLSGRTVDRFKVGPKHTVAPHAFESALKLSPFVLDALLVGRGRAFCTSLIALDESTVGKFARDNDIPYTDHGSLATRQEIIDLVARQVEAVNQGLPQESRVKAFRIFAEPLNGQSEELTPALRLKRHFVESRYAELVEQMYD